MKTFFKISSAVILFTAMLSGLGYKKSNNPMATTVFGGSLKLDPNLGRYLLDKDGRAFIFSQMVHRIKQNDPSPRLW